MDNYWDNYCLLHLRKKNLEIGENVNGLCKYSYESALTYCSENNNSMPFTYACAKQVQHLFAVF